MAYFYSHLIEIETVTQALDEMELGAEDRAHLAKLLDSSLHHAICDAILSELTESEKRVFMAHLTAGKHERIWKFLNERIDNVEDKIKKAADDLKSELQKDIKKAKKLKSK